MIPLTKGSVDTDTEFFTQVVLFIINIALAYSVNQKDGNVDKFSLQNLFLVLGYNVGFGLLVVYSLYKTLYIPFMDYLKRRQARIMEKETFIFRRAWDN